MRLLLTTIILTMLAEPVWAEDYYSCKKIRGAVNQWIENADEWGGMSIAAFHNRDDEESDRLEAKAQNAVSMAARWAEIYSALCKD